MAVLVTGFGSFPGVSTNPTERVAQAVDGQTVGGVRIIGRVLPVSFERGPSRAIALANELAPRLVLGLGVAGRPTICVERRGVRWAWSPTVDVDGGHECLLEGPDEIEATLDTQRLAEALEATLSDDAGDYVCNAWLYRVAQALDVPVGFVHVPPSGISVERLLSGIAALVER